MLKKQHDSLCSERSETCHHVPELPQTLDHLRWSDKRHCKICGAEIFPPIRFFWDTLLGLYFMPVIFAVVMRVAMFFVEYKAVARTIGLACAILFARLSCKFSVEHHYRGCFWITREQAAVVLGKCRIEITDKKVEKRIAVWAIVVGIVTAICVYNIFGQIVGVD